MKYEGINRKRIKYQGGTCILAFLLVFVMILGIVPKITAFADDEVMQLSFGDDEYVGYSKNLDPDLPDSFAYPLYIRNEDTVNVAYCYNSHKQFPPPDDYFGDSSMHDYFIYKPAPTNIKVEKSVKLALYNGFPNNATGLQGGMTNNQFRAVTQAAIWYLHDDLPLEGNNNDNSIYKLNFNGSGNLKFTPEMKNVFLKLTGQTEFELITPPDDLLLRCYEQKYKNSGYEIQNLLTTRRSTPEEDMIRAAKIELEAQKTLDNSSNFNKQFEFELINERGDVIQREKNDEYGKVKFRPLYFLGEGDRNYIIKERILDDGKYEYDKTEYKVKVNVYLDGDRYVADAQYMDMNDTVLDTLPIFKNYTIVDNSSIYVKKQWVGPAAEQIIVKLFADYVEKETAVLRADTNWEHTFNDLPKYDIADGHEIVYTVEEEHIDGYTGSISGDAENGFTITNTLDGKLSIPVTKKWVGETGSSAVINLFADGVKIDSVTLNEGNQWQHTFIDLNKYDADDGHEIVYTVEEEHIDGYNVNISGDAENGFTITNTVTGKVSIPVTKKWVGKEGKFAYINLLADDKKIDKVKLNAENNWQHTFTDLPKYDDVDGHEIVYTVEEDHVEGYTSKITGDAENGFIITNKKHDGGGGGGGSLPNSTSVKLKAIKTLDGKTPDDNMFDFVLKDEDGNVIQIKQNEGKEVIFDPISFSKTGTYTYYIYEIPGNNNTIIYDDAVYKVTVDVKRTSSGDYYATVTYEKNSEEYTGIPLFENITKDKPNDETITVTVNKAWVGDTEQNRPNYITVQLYKDNIAYGEPVILNKDNNWQHIWTGLDKNANWTVDEVNVPDGYTKIITNNGNDWTITNTTNTDLPSVPIEPIDPGVNNDDNNHDSHDNHNHQEDQDKYDEPAKSDKTDRPNKDKTIDKAPQTGDNSHIGVWITLMLISICGLVVTAVYISVYTRNNMNKRRQNKHS